MTQQVMPENYAFAMMVESVAALLDRTDRAVARFHESHKCCAEDAREIRCEVHALVNHNGIHFDSWKELKELF